MSLYSRLDRLASDVEKLDRKVNSVSNAPQGQRTSIEGGGSFEFNDEDGNLKAIVGGQDDGGTTIQVISGPTPPTPVGFTVDVDHGKFIVHWSGDFDGDKLAPSDWSRAEVHASQDPFFVASRATARGSIVSAAGGEVTIGVLKGPWTIKMLAWSQAGKMSAPSTPVDVAVPGYGDIVLEEIDAATTLIKNAGEMLIEGQQTLADKLAGIADLDPEEISAEIAQARQEAVDAALAEIANVEGTLTSAIGGKSSTKWSTSNPPANYDGAVGDTWVKLTSLGSGGREIRRSCWQGDVWVDHPVDGAVLSNVDASTITTGFLDVVNRIRAGAIMGDKLLIGGARNLIPNGDLSQGNASLWPSPTNGTGPTYSATDKPEGFKGSVSYYSTGTISPTDFGRWSVNGVTDLVFEVWAKADKPDSRIYVEVRDQNGALLGSVSRTAFGADGGWKGAPAAASYSYPVASYVVPTTWTKLRSTIKVPPETTEVYMARVYFNHSSGTERDATIGLSGMRLAPMVDGTLITPGGIQTPHLAADVLEVGNFKAGTAALAEAVIKKLFAEVVVARMAQAEEFIGENAILTGAVTAPKITASEELWAKLAQFVRVNAEMVDSDLFQGRVFTGNTYLQDDGSEWSGRGLFIVAPDGETLLNVPTNGEPVTINADNTAIRSASIDKLDAGDTSLTTGAALTLEARQQAYTRAPETRADWYPSATFSRPEPGYSYDWLDLAAWGDKWVRTVNVLGSEGDNSDAIVVYSANGTIEKTILIDINPRHGVAVIGNEAFVLGPDHVARPGTPKNWVHAFDLNTGNRTKRWEYTRAVQNRYALGSNAGRLLMAAVYNSTLYVHQWNSTTGAQVGPDATATWDLGYTKDLIGVHLDGTTLRIGHQKNIRTYTYSSGSLSRKNPDNQGWGNPNNNAAGFDMSKGWPFVVTESGNLFEGSTFDGDGTIVDATVTFRDSSGSETNGSPVASTAIGSRESLAVSIPHRPNMTTRLYYRANKGTWNWADASESTKRLWIDFIPGIREADPPSVNTFPESDPAVMQAAAGPFMVRGDGSGYWGPLKMGRNGIMSGLIASGQVSCKVDKAGTPKKFTVQLPAGRFTKPPVVWVSALTSSPQNVATSVLGAGITTTSFDLWFYRTDLSGTGVTWFAMDSE